MDKKNRFRILLACVICFAVGVPYIILYSLGYRVDFLHREVIATGGIYVRTFPSADQIIIDSKDFEQPAMFANSIFVQNLLPQSHTVLIKKSGYYDYSKTLPVVENLATKLENVLLFKKNIAFSEISDTPAGVVNTQDPFLAQIQHEKFAIKTNNLYYSTTPQNSKLTTLQKNTPLIKGLVAFTISNNEIFWLGTDGFLNKSDITGKNLVKLVETPFKIIKAGTYKIIIYGNNIFVNNNGNLEKLNYLTGEFDSLYTPVYNVAISPDGKNIVYSTKKEIYITSFEDQKIKNVLLYKSPTDEIKNIVWLNDSYIIFVAGNNITISEIDYRGNINITTLPQTITLSEKESVPLKSPQIIFNQQENKLYILTNKVLLVSEKLTP